MRAAPYLLIDVVHPEAQGLPEGRVAVPAARLRLQQAGLLQAVQGQDVLVAVRLQEGLTSDQGRVSAPFGAEQCPSSGLVCAPGTGTRLSLTASPAHCLEEGLKMLHTRGPHLREHQASHRWPATTRLCTSRSAPASPTLATHARCCCGCPFSAPRGLTTRPLLQCGLLRGHGARGTRTCR